MAGVLDDSGHNVLIALDLPLIVLGEGATNNRKIRDFNVALRKVPAICAYDPCNLIRVSQRSGFAARFKTNGANGSNESFASPKWR